MEINLDDEYINSLYARTSSITPGAKKLQPTDRQAKILKDLWGRGTVRQDELAKALGVSIGTMRRWAEEMEASVK